jgi:hypothetical protein
MKVKFTTTLEEETIKQLKILAIRKACRANELIEESVKQLLDREFGFHYVKDYSFPDSPARGSSSKAVRPAEHNGRIS